MAAFLLPRKIARGCGGQFLHIPVTLSVVVHNLDFQIHCQNLVAGIPEIQV
jgi:hypothetical protein